MEWIKDIDGDSINPTAIARIYTMEETRGFFINRKTGKFLVMAELKMFDAGSVILKKCESEKEAKSFRDEIINRVRGR